MKNPNLIRDKKDKNNKNFSLNKNLNIEKFKRKGVNEMGGSNPLKKEYLNKFKSNDSIDKLSFLSKKSCFFEKSISNKEETSLKNKNNEFFHLKNEVNDGKNLNFYDDVDGWNQYKQHLLFYIMRNYFNHWKYYAPIFINETKSQIQKFVHKSLKNIFTSKLFQHIFFRNSNKGCNYAFYYLKINF
jgi:hypothetical protein